MGGEHQGYASENEKNGSADRKHAACEIGGLTGHHRIFSQGMLPARYPAAVTKAMTQSAAKRQDDSLSDMIRTSRMSLLTCNYVLLMEWHGVETKSPGRCERLGLLLYGFWVYPV